jgi:adenylate cyclase
MAKEIERKFLVRGEFIHLAVKKTGIIQSYLSIDSSKSIRLRVCDNQAFITIKSKIDENTISRNEWEFPIPFSDVEELFKICLPGKIVKTRFLVPSGEKHTFEVDVFHDGNEGLIIAEIELSSEDEEFERPDWLGDEVTGLSQYYNVNLRK